MNQGFQLTGQKNQAGVHTATERTRCWCGGKLNGPEVTDYLRCVDCMTFASRLIPDQETLRENYRREYWQSLPKAFGYPSIQERAESDSRDRIPVWYMVLALFAPPPARLLEIGCGHGGFLAYARDHGFEEVVGIEPDPQVAQFGRNKFQLKHLVSGFFPEVDLPHKTYDIIAAFDVLEHLLDPVASLKAIGNMLAEDGICIIQTPCHRGEASDWEQFAPEHKHIYLFNRESVRRILEKTGFQVEASIPGYFLHDVIFVASKTDTKRHPLRRAFSGPAFHAKLQSLYAEISDIRTRNEHSVIRDRDAWVKRYEDLIRQVNEKEEEISRLAEAVQGHEKALRDRASSLMQKEDEIKKLAHEADNRLVEIQKISAVVQTTQKDVETFRASVQSMEKALREKEREILALKSTADERLNAMLQKEEALNTQRAELKRKEQEIHQLGDTRIQQQEKISKLQQELQTKEKELRKLILDLTLLKENWGYRLATKTSKVFRGKSKSDT